MYTFHQSCDLNLNNRHLKKKAGIVDGIELTAE